MVAFNRIASGRWMNRALTVLGYANVALIGGHAAAFTLNDTGQSLCYDGSAMVACQDSNTGDSSSYPGQDGRYGRDAQANLAKIGAGAGGFDYTKVCFDGTLDCTDDLNLDPYVALTSGNDAHGGWACSLDNHTGLLWALRSTDVDTWDVASGRPSSANAATLCGRSANWRLPTRHELYSLVNYGHYGAGAPAGQRILIDPDYFPGPDPANPATNTLRNYWTSEMWAPQVSLYRYYIDFQTGDSNVSNITGTDANHTRLVNGDAAPAASYTDNGDGTVTDNITGLMWDQCLYGASTATDCSGTVQLLTWQNALAAAVTSKQSNYKGYGDWRLPNFTEIESLYHLGSYDNAGYTYEGVIDPTYFKNQAQSATTSSTDAFWSTWTSTTSPPNPSKASRIYFYDGNVFGMAKTNLYAVRLVRGGGNFDLLDTIFQNGFE